MRKVAASLVAGLLAGMAVAPAPSGAVGNTSTWCQDRSDLAVIGASSETGYGTTGYSSPNDGYAVTRNGWVSRVAMNASAEWGTHVEVHAHNGALGTDYYPGGRWADMTNTMQKIQAQQPDMVIMQVAVNEYVNSVPVATAKQRVERLVDDVRSARPGVDILLLTYPDIQWPAASIPWSQYGNMLHNVAVSKGVGLVDQRQYIDSPVNDKAKLWFSDRAHLNDAGQTITTSMVYTLLWSTLASC